MFEELDYRQTRFGELILRKRTSPTLRDTVYEVMLGGEHLMSSQVNDSELALATIGLQAARAPLGAVLVGGLGLGYTAAAALDHPAVSEVTVIEALADVIGWHRSRLVPLGERLTGDPRCRLEHADFFARMAAPASVLYSAILVDIDHAPDSLLHGDHGGFYSIAGLEAAREHLLPGGSLALWSADEPQPAFAGVMQEVFDDYAAHVIAFDNPLTGPDRNWILVGLRA